MDTKRIKEIQDRMTELRSMLEADQEVNLEEIRSEIESLNQEKEEIRARQELADKINTNKIESKVIEKVENQEEKRNMENKNLDSMEYREAFMAFCQTGKMAEEFRATAMTSANTAVIPVTTLNKIVEKMETYGNILPLVSKVAYPSGVSIPTANMGITATWTAEGSVAEKQGAAGIHPAGAGRPGHRRAGAFPAKLQLPEKGWHPYGRPAAGIKRRRAAGHPEPRQQKH